MKYDNYAVVLVTAPDEEEAKLIASVLLEQNQAACVNIVPQVSSLFRWGGRLEQPTESLLIVKTRIALLDNITKLIKQLHSYKNPEVIALPIIGGSREYVDWIFNETKDTR